MCLGGGYTSVRPVRVFEMFFWLPPGRRVVTVTCVKMACSWAARPQGISADPPFTEMTPLGTFHKRARVWSWVPVAWGRRSPFFSCGGMDNGKGVAEQRFLKHLPVLRR